MGEIYKATDIRGEPEHGDMPIVPVRILGCEAV